jgi:hypothetical protein
MSLKRGYVGLKILFKELTKQARKFLFDQNCVQPNKKLGTRTAEITKDFKAESGML